MYTSAKECLRKIRLNQIRLENLSADIENIHLHASGGGIDYAKDRVDTSAVNQMEEAGWKLLERLEVLKLEQNALTAETSMIMGWIRGMEKPEFVEVLDKRYREGLDFMKIAECMNFSYDWVLHLHGEALEAFRKKYLEFDETQQEKTGF